MIGAAKVIELEDLVVVKAGGTALELPVLVFAL